MLNKSFSLFYVSQESNGPSDAYSAISNADRLQAEPESLRKWREEQQEKLEVLGKHRANHFISVDRPHCSMRCLVSFIFLLRCQLPQAGGRVEGEGQGGAGGVACQAE